MVKLCIFVAQNSQNMKKNLLLICLLLSACLASIGQNLYESRLYERGTVKPKGEQYAKYDVGVTYLISLGLPDVDKAAPAQRKALTAVRDQALNRALGSKFIPGDTEYKKVVNRYLDAKLNELEEMMTPFDENMLFAYKWYLEVSGFMIELAQMDPKSPFYSFYLREEFLVGNILNYYTMMHFERATGKYLTPEDLFDFTQENQEAIRMLIFSAIYQELNVSEVDYDYNVKADNPFEIRPDGLNYYIPTDDYKNPLVTVFVDRQSLMPYLRHDGLLYQYWTK